MTSFNLSDSDRDLNEAERDAIVRGSLGRLRVLQRTVEDDPSFALYMAVELWNIFNNRWTQSDLKLRMFPTPAIYVNGLKKELLIPLVQCRLLPNPLGIEFAPFMSHLQGGMRYDYIPFKSWWKTEIAHQPMRHPDEDIVDDMIDLTRFGIIRAIRNKLAAHHDNIRPQLLDEIEHSMLVKGWTFDIDGVRYQVGDGDFTVLYSYMYALLRQISYEAIMAFEGEVTA